MSDITPNVLKTLTDNGRQSIHIIYYQKIIIIGNKAVTKKKVQVPQVCTKIGFFHLC